MVKTMSLPKRAVALFSAAIIAVSMVCAMPLSAMAADNSGYVGTIKATGQQATVQIGNTLDMHAGEGSDVQFKITTTVEGAYHVDYKITATEDGGAANINKHSGILTPQSAGKVTVTAYLLDCAQPSGVNTNPCFDENVIGTASKTVTITAGDVSDYGWQGEDVQILMNSFDPTVNVSASDPENGIYVNTLTGVQAANGFYSFAVSQSSGTGGNYAQFVSNNAGKITLTRGQNATSVATLGDGILTLEGTAQSNDVTVQIPESALSSGNYTLTFDSGYKAGNGKTLGATVSFTFSISQS